MSKFEEKVFLPGQSMCDKIYMYYKQYTEGGKHETGNRRITECRKKYVI